MKPQTALDKIAELGQQLMLDPNPDTAHIGAALLAIPITASEDIDDLNELIRMIFMFVKMIKGAPGYTEGIGLLLGVVGEELPMPPPPGEAPSPELTVKIIAGTLNQYVNVKYYKRSHEYVVIECRRGTGDWEQIAQSKKSPFIDNRNLLVAGQAEVREYRARFWDNGAPTSDWCDIARITVGP